MTWVAVAWSVAHAPPLARPCRRGGVAEPLRAVCSPAPQELKAEKRRVNTAIKATKRVPSGMLIAELARREQEQARVDAKAVVPSLLPVVGHARAPRHCGRVRALAAHAAWRQGAGKGKGGKDGKGKGGKDKGGK